MSKGKIEIVYRVVEIQPNYDTRSLIRLIETPLVAFDKYEDAEKYIEENVLDGQYSINKVFLKKEVK